MFSVSCALRAPERKIANAEIPVKFGKHDSQRSLVQIFPATDVQKDAAFYLYVQLKDAQGKFVDARPAEFNLKTRKGHKIDFDFERVLDGRYYLTILKSERIESHEIDLFVQGKALKEQFKLQLKRPHEKFTKLKLLKNNKHTHSQVFELRLADGKNRPLEVPEVPELVFEGPGQVAEAKHIREGIWHITVIYPDENHISYYGVRSMGVTFQKLYRYQHVEKWEDTPLVPPPRNTLFNNQQQ